MQFHRHRRLKRVLTSSALATVCCAVSTGCAPVMYEGAFDPVYEFRAGVQLDDMDYACDQFLYPDNELKLSKRSCVSMLKGERRRNRDVKKYKAYEYRYRVVTDEVRSTEPPGVSVVATVPEGEKGRIVKDARAPIVSFTTRLTNDGWKIVDVDVKSPELGVDPAEVFARHKNERQSKAV